MLLIEYGLGQGCNKWRGNINQHEKLLILQEHNNYRNQIALQTNRIGPKLPFAVDMLQMYWSDELAKKAQEWANRCRFQHSPSAFRKFRSYSAGENLYISKHSANFQSMDWRKAIFSWWNEIKIFPSNRVSSFSSGGPMIGHFTQIIWASTYHVGCGFSQFKEGSWFSNFYVCMYGPAGNVITRPIYTTSNKKECRCPRNTSCSNKEWPGLCCLRGKCSKNSLI